MSLLDGIAKFGKEAVGFATAPLRTGAKIVGTGLETSGNVLTNLAEGDVGGAANAVGNGVSKQVGNVTGHFKEQFGHVAGMAEGYGDFVVSGAKFAGEPVRGAARLAGNSLSTAGETVTDLANGDVGGAIGAQGRGFSNAVNIVGDTAGNQVNNLVG